MLGTFSLRSVSSRIRAIVDKTQNVFVRKSADKESDATETVEVPKLEQQSDFEVHSVETESHEEVKIMVTSRPETVYFDEPDYEPVVVKVASDFESETVKANVGKRADIASKDPSELFNNALRRPTRKTLFDSQTPVYRKKSVVAVADPVPVSAPEPAREPVEFSAEAGVSKEVPIVVDVPTIEESPVAATVVEPAPVETAVAVAVPVVEVPEEVSVPEVVEVVSEPKVEVVQIECTEPVTEVVSELAEESAVDGIEPLMEQPAPVMVTPAIPVKKIEVPELEKEEVPVTEIQFAVENAVSTETSAEAAEVQKSVDELETVSEEKVLAPVILDETDALLIFNSGLKEEGEQMEMTSMSDDSLFPEDYLDETETTFKIRRPRIQYGGFNGDLRSLCRY